MDPDRPRYQTQHERGKPLPSENGTTQQVSRTFTWKLRPESGLDCLVWAISPSWRGRDECEDVTDQLFLRRDKRAPSCHPFRRRAPGQSLSRASRSASVDSSSSSVLTKYAWMHFCTRFVHGVENQIDDAVRCGCETVQGRARI